MKTIEQQHAEVVKGLRANTTHHMVCMGKNVSIKMKDGEIRKGYCNEVGTYFLSIKGLNDTIDPSLKGKTKIEYVNIETISIL